MKRLFTAATSLAFAAAFGLVAVAQSTQPPATTTTQPQTSGQTQMPHQDHMAAQPVTIVGCVQREADYRSANNLGRGGAVGTGVGVGNEFVLINASMSTSMTSTAGAATGTTTGTAGTAGGAATAGAGQAFEVSGEKEAQLEQYVGKRVEVVAKLKAAETGPAGTTGGATAGKPPTGVDITSPDLRLKEIEIVSVRESTGTCPAK
jgi:hypothetical protein